jgi:iron complex transport system permease protein
MCIRDRAFVALLAGPIARRLTGNSGAALATSALTGGLILSLADLAGRLVLAPMQLPAGLFTAAAGAPFLLWLLLRKPAA